MSRPAKSIHGQWSSRWAFILAATGAAVGLGNIWKFPYITGENGGGAFVLVYLLCIAAIGIPVMMAEILIGRRGRQNPVNSLHSLAAEEGKNSFWKYLGWSGVLSGFLILSYYSVIAGQAMAYVFRTFSGVFEGVTADGAKSIYSALINDPERLLAWHTVFMVFTMVVVARGVKGGLEKSVRFLMPALFAILLMLVGYAASTGEYFAQGLEFLFKPDFSKLSGEGVLTAMGHAFFTLSLGMGAIMVYGSYLPQKTSIMKVSIAISIADTLVALLAGMAIFPLVFANELATGAGPGLIFETLPIAFGHMVGGTFFGGMFFLLLVFAAWSSAISLIEPAIAWLVENKDVSRRRACVIAGFATWALGLLTVLSFNVGKSWTLFGQTMFGLLDYLTANIMLPLGGLLIAIFAGWIMKQQSTEDELAIEQPRLYIIWRALIRYVTPAAIVIVFIKIIGLF
ncbi:MAG: sodium-dependent transporter [Gammaproteobacteria bacterium]|nr:sodium-dependent transporter [Gammaproteobacteria bacterium]MDH5591772.1 sodium-dependent transporter [Gammaproteobacteria bacterium]